jgi:hypothetical protein
MFVAVHRCHAAPSPKDSVCGGASVRYKLDSFLIRGVRPLAALLSVTGLLTACGGGGGAGGSNGTGTQNTYLSVQAQDANGDALHYQWRVTGGVIENTDANEVRWSLPKGPGLHFAYVIVSDGKGGYTEQQYAVSSDALQIPADEPAPVTNTPAAVTEFAGGSSQLTLTSPDTLSFLPPGGGARLPRTVYLPDMQVRVLNGGTVVATGTTDLFGHLNAPKLATGNYTVKCTSLAGHTERDCGTLSVGTDADQAFLQPTLPGTQNLRLFGHVALSDGSVCGIRNSFAGLESAATVQLLQSDDTVLSTPIRVNAYGDYAIDAAVAVNAALKLRVRCEALSLDWTVPSDGSGYASARPIELSGVLPNTRPTVQRMLAVGPDGNVRGQAVLPDSTAHSASLPSAEQFLTYKGQDSRQSSCAYYKSFGAVGACDSQGNPTAAISFNDWKRARKLAPYNGLNAETSATYVNKMDLNLVRRMVATKVASNDIAFYVCNHPGPLTTAQLEVDQVIDTALSDLKQVACVAMEFAVTPGTNNNQPFTKFLTFGPDGRLMLSINLDGRGEKFMPGACVACHGGSQYRGSFPSIGTPSPNLGSNFLPFDTGNFLFSSRSDLTEPMQSAAIKALNYLVKDTATVTQPGGAITALVDGWYSNGTSGSLDKDYVPSYWANNVTPGAAAFYKGVVARSCRTCHAAMRDQFNWDSHPPFGSSYLCGGSRDLALNAVMPNALITADRWIQNIQNDATLSALTLSFLGCTSPSPDPVYPRR